METIDCFDFSVPENKAFLCSLSQPEFRIISCLVKTFGAVFPKTELVCFVWPHGEGWYENIELGVYISNIRKKLVLHKAPLEIVTRRGYGYMLRKKE